MTFPLVDILGVVVEVRTPLRFRPTLQRLLADLPRRVSSTDAPDRVLALEPGQGTGLVLVEDGAVVLEPVAEDVAMATVVWRLNAIAAASTSHIVLHAGAVADGDDGLLLPGRSGAGKSWLTAACVETGFDYLSDEHAAVDRASGLLTPLAKPLDLGVRRLTTAGQLRPGSVGSASPPSAIVFPRYGAGLGTSVTRLTPAAAVLGLGANCANLASLGGAGFCWLAGLAITCPAWQVSYGNADDAVAAIRQALRNSETVMRAPARPASATAPITAATTTVVLDDDVVVFDARTTGTHHLNRSAGLVWLCAAGVTDRRALADLVLAEAPAGAIHPEDIEATIDHLCDVGLLSVS